jgi:putative flippase GtrA
MTRLSTAVGAGAAHPMLRDRRVRFVVVGGGAASLELAVFELAVLIGAGVVPANVISFVVGLVVSFAGHAMWSFSGNQSLAVRSQFGAYALLALINSAITSVLIQAFTTWGLKPWIAKALCMVMVAIWNYGLLSRLVFRRVASAEDTRRRRRSVSSEVLADDHDRDAA